MRYNAQQCVKLAEGVTFIRPPSLPKVIRLDDPAIEVMTDFNYVLPRTVRPDMRIDDALETMKAIGVRLLLVVDAADDILGLVTSRDIQGERAIDQVTRNRVPRAEITVGMIMTPRAEIDALSIDTVNRVKVGHIVETLQQQERQHLLVVAIDPASGLHRVCGMFSMTQIRKQLAGHASRIQPHDHTATLAELAHAHHFGG